MQPRVLVRSGDTKRKRVALAFPSGVPHTERITAGVIDYARGRSWELVLGPEAAKMPIGRFAGRSVGGVLAFIDSAAEARAAGRLGVPVVNLSSALPALPPYTVTVENRSVGGLAAEHLIQRGFERFGFCGVSRVGYAHDRGAGFSASVCAAGYSCSVLPVGRRGVGDGGVPDRRQIERWLARLARPVGVMAAHDYQARTILAACNDLGLRVPNDVAVVGVDNDVTLCDLTSPSLSSVALPGFEIGRRAAELLDALMRGETPPRQPVFVRAREIVVRGSTDVFAFGDPALGRAVKIISERFAEPLAVGALAREVGVTRRLLERRFRDALGSSPNEFIRRERVNRAKRLLTTQHAPRLKEVAADEGFPDVRSMNLAFHQLEGMGAGDYRSSRGMGRER
jgi:LacI family transcriptional regulator